MDTEVFRLRVAVLMFVSLGLMAIRMRRPAYQPIRVQSIERPINLVK